MKVAPTIVAAAFLLAASAGPALAGPPVETKIAQKKKTATKATIAKADQKKVLVQCLAGSNDPTRANLCLIAAFGIAEAGHKPTLVFSGEAAYLLIDEVANATVGVGLGKASDWFKKIKKHEIPIFV
jgi:hypothetical protein